MLSQWLGMQFLKNIFYILNNLSEVEPYIATHKTILKKKYSRMYDKLLLIEENKKFISSFNKRISSDDSAYEIIKWLSYMQKFNVITWIVYNISNFSFYTKGKDDRSTMQNSWVIVKAESMYFSSLKDKNPILASRVFHGVIEQILEIDYVIFKVYLFKCKWVPNKNGAQTDELGFTRVDLDKETYITKSFIMASQEK